MLFLITSGSLFAELLMGPSLDSACCAPNL